MNPSQLSLERVRVLMEVRRPLSAKDIEWDAEVLHAYVVSRRGDDVRVAFEGARQPGSVRGCCLWVKADQILGPA
jgi:hypothetical protein